MGFTIRHGDLELVAALVAQGEGFATQAVRHDHAGDDQFRCNLALVAKVLGVERRANVLGPGRQVQFVHGSTQHHARTDDLDLGSGVTGFVAGEGAQFAKDLVLVLGLDLQQGVGLVDRGGAEGVQGTGQQAGQQAQADPGLVEQQDVEQATQVDFVVVLLRTVAGSGACVLAIGHGFTSSSCFSIARKRQKSVDRRKQSGWRPCDTGRPLPAGCSSGPAASPCHGHSG